MTREKPQQAVDAWNALVKVGATVEYRELLESPPRTFTTRSSAQVLSGHTAVIWLNGKSGCVCLDHCRAVS